MFDVKFRVNVNHEVIGTRFLTNLSAKTQSWRGKERITQRGRRSQSKYDAQFEIFFSANKIKKQQKYKNFHQPT